MRQICFTICILCNLFCSGLNFYQQNILSGILFMLASAAYGWCLYECIKDNREKR